MMRAQVPLLVRGCLRAPVPPPTRLTVSIYCTSFLACACLSTPEPFCLLYLQRLIGKATGMMGIASVYCVSTKAHVQRKVLRCDLAENSLPSYPPPGGGGIVLATSRKTQDKELPLGHCGTENTVLFNIQSLDV